MFTSARGHAGVPLALVALSSARPAASDLRLGVATCAQMTASCPFLDMSHAVRVVRFERFSRSALANA